MKHLLVIAIALITFSVSAQNKERKNKRFHKTDFTPEQIATLQTKRMALALDLTESQQIKIQELNLQNAKERIAKREEIKKRRKGETMKKLSKEERFEMQNNRLDKAIASKAEIKNILSKEQFEKWEKAKQRREMKKRGNQKNRKKIDRSREFQMKERN